jgi:non-ribosomal peptide synthase protein (TIGR01720 family)
MMGHGRDDIAADLDVRDTVGFFISYTPLVLRVPRDVDDSSLSAQLEPLVASRLSYDLLRYMTSDAQMRRSFSGLPRAEVLLNYYGKLNEPDELPRSSMFEAAPESAGDTHHPEGIRYYPLTIPSRIYRDQLQLWFVYSSNLHDRATIERLTEAFRARLLAAITEAAD